MPRLTGKVAWVTGAGSGIGEAAALALADEGTTVILTGRTASKLERVAERIDQTGHAHVQAADLTDKAQVRRVGDYIRDTFGRLDILINNAGVIEPISHVATCDPAAWARNIEINLIGAFYALRAALGHMVAHGGGTIVNISSGAAIRPLEGWSAYCTGKAGMHMLTRAVALENASNGIRIFGFQPGTTDTDMQVKIRASGMNPVSQMPRGDLLPVAIPAAGILYLCTPAADDLNGQETNIRDDAFRSRLNLG